MAAAAKPGADLLWAFQLHREHGALSKRLKALESMTAQRQDRIAESEQNARSAHDERFEALARQLQTLQGSDVIEQVAGLASEIRATRHQVDQVRDKVKSVENASKETNGKNQERQQVASSRFGDLESTLAQVQRTLLGFDGRLQVVAQHGARVAAEGLETRQRYDDEISDLREQLSALQNAEHELRVFIEGVARDCQKAPVVAPALDQTSTAPLNIAAASHVTALPDSTRERTALDRTTPASPNTTHATTIPKLQQEHLVTDQAKRVSPNTITASHPNIVSNSKNTEAKQAKPPVKAKRFEKEIASLIHGEGSLTNAPKILQNELPLKISNVGTKKRKAPAGEGPLLRATFTQRETRSQAKKIKQEPPVTRLKAPTKTSKRAATGTKPVGKNGSATRQTANTTTTTTTRITKDPVRHPKCVRPCTPDLPLPPPSSDRIVVELSQDLVDPPTPTPLPLASRGNGKGKRKGKVGVKVEQRPQQQQRRRRIKQDDSMEEFLAKCRASTGGN